MNGHTSEAAKAVLQAQEAVQRAEARVARREARECVIIQAPSNSAAPLPSASPPLRAAVPHSPPGPTVEEVMAARSHLYAALRQAPHDGLVDRHIRDAYALLGGKL